MRVGVYTVRKVSVKTRGVVRGREGVRELQSFFFSSRSHGYAHTYFIIHLRESEHLINSNVFLSHRIQIIGVIRLQDSKCQLTLAHATPTLSTRPSHHLLQSFPRGITWQSSSCIMSLTKAQTSFQGRIVVGQGRSQ